MKAVYAAVLSGAAVAVAQNTTLAECGSTCINNMIARIQQSPYGCPNNPTCFCCKPDFGFGVIDCANQYCAGDTAAATSAIVYAASYCASALPQTSVCTSFSGAGLTGGSSPSTTGAPAAGTPFLVPVSGGLAGYSVASTTITAGGAEATLSGTAYTALSSNGGVIATGSGVTTTYDVAALQAIASAASSASGNAGGAGGAGGAFLVPVSSGSSGYSIASTTITAGGVEATLSGTAYSALPSNGGVVATASGVTTTYALSALQALANATSSGAASGAAGSSSAGVTTITTTTSTAASSGGANGVATTTSTSRTGGAAFITAAPAVIGAAALAVLAL